MTPATQNTSSAAARDIFTENCSAWSCAPWKPGARHEVITVLQFITATQGHKWAGNIERVRGMLASAWDAQRQAEAATSPEDEARLLSRRDNFLNDYKAGKEASPCAILQGVNEGRKADTFTSLARVLCIDIDSAKPGEEPNGNEFVQDWNQVKNDLGRLPWVSYAGISAGGRGVFLLIPIARDDAESYAEYYNAWAYLLQHHYNLITDASCKNRNRLRFMTHDPAPIINRAALVWDRFLQVPQDWRTAPTLGTPSTLDNEQKSMVREAVNYCTRNGVNLAENYDDWMRLAAFFAHFWDDDEGRELFHALASLSYKYRAGENDRKLLDLGRHHSNPVKIGTFVKICRDAGVPIKGTGNRPAFKPWPGNAQTMTPAPMTGEASTTAAAPHAWNIPQERKERPQDERNAAAYTVAPLQHPEGTETPQDSPQPSTMPAASAQPETPTEAPGMSASEAYILDQMTDYLQAGENLCNAMREENPLFDALCTEFDCNYIGWLDENGRGYTMSKAQEAAYYDRKSRGDNAEN